MKYFTFTFIALASIPLVDMQISEYADIFLWEDCVVKYTIPNMLNFVNDKEGGVDDVVKIISFIEDHSMIRFLYTNDTKNIVIYTRGGPTTKAGMPIEGNVHRVDINREGNYTRSVLKMIMYSLGFLTEVNRKDRDKYVKFHAKFLKKSIACQKYYMKYMDYPPKPLGSTENDTSIPLDFDFDSVTFPDILQCTNCRGCGVFTPNVAGYDKIMNERFVQLYGDRRRQPVNKSQLFNEVRRMEAFYPYEYCLTRTVDGLHRL